MNDYKNRRGTANNHGSKQKGTDRGKSQSVKYSVPETGCTETRSEGKTVRDKVIRRTGGKTGENSNGWDKVYRCRLW